MSKIQTMDGVIQIKVQEAIAGTLNTSSRESAIEYAEVVEVPKHDCNKDVTKCIYWNIHKGDHIFFKSWAVDIVSHDGKKYYFINMETNGVLAVMR